MGKRVGLGLNKRVQRRMLVVFVSVNGRFVFDNLSKKPATLPEDSGPVPSEKRHNRGSGPGA